MIIIADSGTSKTDWALMDDSLMDHPLMDDHSLKAQSLKCKGLNPFFVSKTDIAESISSTFYHLPSHNDIKQIFFYGAGCHDDEQKKTIHAILSQIFPSAAIHVFSDLMGTARACLKSQEGIFANLGTAANSGMYNGSFITRYIRPLGYILGDEGSGVYFGKELMKKYLHAELPKTLERQLEETYKTDRNQIITDLYASDQPNHFLLTFARFVVDNQNNETIAGMIEKGLDAFFKYYIVSYPDAHRYPLAFTGSMAYFLKGFLYKVSEKYQLTIHHIYQSTINELIVYHGSVK